MFFLIRCAFWLTVVFATIFSPDQGPATAPRPVETARQANIAGKPEASGSTEAISQAVQGWTTAALQHFWSKATSGCASAPGECAALAERLSDFARQHPFKAQARTEPALPVAPAPAEPARAQAAEAAPSHVPLPPVRPQHLGVRTPITPAHELLGRPVRERSTQS
jgi:hypothetical protein